VYGQSPRNRSNDTVKSQSQGENDEESISPNISGLTRKQQQILGIGMKYPEPPPGIRRSPHTSIEAYHSSLVSTASNISGVHSGYSVWSKALKASATKSKGKSESPTDKKSPFRFSSFLKKDPKPVKQKPRLGGRLIEHVTHNNMKEVNNYIADSEDQGAALKEYMPPILKRYNAEIANRKSEEYLARCTALDPYADKYAEYLASRSGSASISSSNRSTESVARPLHYLRPTQSSYSIGEFVPIAPNPPFARGIMHRHSADTLHAPPSRAISRAQPPRRNTSTVASQVLGENPDNDNQFWFNTITENDISFPTHRAMGEILPNSNAVFIRPGWLAAERAQPGPGDYRLARDLEIRQIAEGMPDDSTPRRMCSNISQKNRNSDGSDRSNGKQPVRASDPRPESRWSAYSDEEPQQSGHSWRQPLSWGTTKKKGLYHTYESRDSNEAMVLNTTLSEAPPATTTSKFKLFGSNFLNKASTPKAGNSASAPNLTSKTSQGNSTESILGRIDPATYQDPHPGTRVTYSPPPMKARKVLKDAYVSINPAKREERRGRRRRDELKQQISLPVEATSNPEFWA